MKTQKITEYIISKKEVINSILGMENKEEVLRELSQSVENIEPSIKLQELNNKIVFIPVGKERFKGRILYDFLLKMFGEKYTSDFWDLIEENKNISSINIDKFILMGEKVNQETTEFSKDTEDMKKIILSTYLSIRDRKFDTALEGYKKIFEAEGELFDEKVKKNLKYLLEASYSAMNTNEYRKFTEDGKNNIFEECLTKCSIYLEEKSIGGNREEEPESKKETAESSEISTEKGSTTKKSEEKKTVISGKTHGKSRIHTKSTTAGEAESKSIRELMSETIQLFENNKFDKAVHNIKILAEIDRLLIKNNTDVKYLLEAVLLRTGRFFMERKIENKRYWGYFQDKYEMKREFYENILKLRGYLGKGSGYPNEEYEVWRRD